MSAADFHEIWRAFNGIGALVALVAFGLSSIRRWRRLTERSKLYAEVISAFLFATMVGSIENILQGNPIGSRTFITTAAIIWTLYAVLFTDEGLTKVD